MNTIIIFLYVISVVMWWAGFNYAAARASTARRRKLFSTAATLALAWPFAFIALAAALATKAAANIMIAVGDHINNTWDAAVSDEGGYTSAAVSEETSPALADNTPLTPPPPPPATDADDHDVSTKRTPAATKRLRRPPTTQTWTTKPSPSRRSPSRTSSKQQSLTERKRKQ